VEPGSRATEKSDELPKEKDHEHIERKQSENPFEENTVWA